MQYELQGKLIVKNDTVQVSDKFTKREFVLEKTEQGGNGQMFVESILFQLTQDRCGLLDSYSVGDTVKAFFNVKGRAWQSPKDGTTRYFNNLEAWKLEKVDGTQTSANMPQNDVPPPTEEDDLPF
jgi:hypothetical protein